MSVDVLKAIAATTELIERQLKKGDYEFWLKSFDGYQRCYGNTNENIKGTLNLIDFSGRDTALTVLASGDQPFNLISKGIKFIDTFDSNKLTEFFALGFKRAMILKYDYYSFLAIMTVITEDNVGLNYVTNLILGLLSYMEFEHAFYWKSVANINYKLQNKCRNTLNLFRMLCNWTEIDNITLANDYLKDESSYEALRRSLGSINITFKCANAMDLANEFSNKKYDVIVLSNILDYFYKLWGAGFTKVQLLSYIRCLEKILSPDAVIFLHYVFEYITSDGITRECLIRNSRVSPCDIGALFYQLPKLNPDSRIKDASIILRMTK